jgi:PAS domain S-box-containing protein
MARKKESNERQKMEIELRNLAKFPSENPNAILRFNKDGVLLYSNPSSENMLGKMLEESNRKLPEHWHKHVAKAFSSGNRQRFEEHINGFIYSFLVAPLVSEGYVNIYGEDITKHKRAEQALQQAKRDWERTFDSVPDLIAILDKQHRVLRANHAMAQRLGTTPERCIGLTCYQCVHGTKAPPDFCPHTLTVQDGQEHIAEVHAERLGGFFAVSTTPLRDGQGSMIGSVHVAHDITAKKKREDALREVQHDLNRAQAVVHTGSWRLYTSHNELLWSDETYRMFGIKTGTPLTYETFLDTIHPDDRAYVDQKWNAALHGEPYDIEHRIMVNGEVKWVREKAELDFTDDGTLLGGFGIVQDITDRKQMEAKLEKYTKHLEELVEEKTRQLRDAERLSAIGQTAGMVGHDIRNPLQSIIGELYLAKGELESLPESDTKKSLEETVITIEEQASYINKIVTDLQDFAKPLKPCNEETNLETILQSVISSMEFPENIELTYAFKEGFPKFKADTAYVKRILTNLFSNAVQAMPNGGKLVFNASHENGSVVINVEDTGVGITEEAKLKLFQPLFTTKSKGQGFGLAVCKRLVEAMNGTISFDSEEGRGTRFTIKLPASSNIAKQ